MYPLNHKFSDHELQAWNTMLRAVGCTNITPFSNKISPNLLEIFGSLYTPPYQSANDDDTLGFEKKSLPHNIDKSVTVTITNDKIAL
ncbi:5793_t:CDS:2 [Entrophospora sp. SA101]|nr:5793_t:CDS:2 [Entrophospora sp. SA101]